ncbi:valine--tRNA ligase [Amycolatopsis alba]|nr:valine--tRNA ligase [Amycolatopsis alba]
MSPSKSSVTTIPTALREQTSIAAVRYGRPIGSRCR